MLPWLVGDPQGECHLRGGGSSTNTEFTYYHISASGMGHVRAEMSCGDQNYSVSVSEGIFSDSMLDSREAEFCM